MKDKIIWTQSQREILDKAISNFKAYIKTSDYQSDLQEREKRKQYFQKELPDRLKDLSEADVEEILNNLLWAHKMWANKNYLAQRLIEENGLDTLKQNLRMLYDFHDDPEEAYERFISSIKRWGPAAVTEMLACIYPERCGIWNKQVRTALEILKLDEFVPIKKYRLSKDEYQNLNSLLRTIAEELIKAGITQVDLLIVDFFLFQVANISEPVEPDQTDFDHDEIRDLIAQIGDALGFDTEIEARIAHGAQVDVVWRTRIGNLGAVTYIFEVHRRGSIDSLILNLQKALNAPSVQKVIAVSDREQLKRIQAECEGLPEQFRHALRLWDVSEVEKVSTALQQAMDSINKLGLLEKREK